MTIIRIMYIDGWKTYDNKAIINCGMQHARRVIAFVSSNTERLPYYLGDPDRCTHTMPDWLHVNCRGSCIMGQNASQVVGLPDAPYRMILKTK